MPQNFCVGIEVQRAERNLDLEGPADLAAPHLRVPDAVPLAVLKAGAAQRVAHQPRRVHLEEVARLLVVEGVDVPHEAIVGLQELVASALVAQPLLGLRVVAGDAHVEGVLAEEDADLGLLGGRLAVVGILLDEICGRNRAAPGRLVQRCHPARSPRSRQFVRQQPRGAAEGHSDLWCLPECRART